MGIINASSLKDVFMGNSGTSVLILLFTEEISGKYAKEQTYWMGKYGIMVPLIPQSSLKDLLCVWVRTI